MRWSDDKGQAWSLHEACYVGRLDAVTALLELGADPNGDAAIDDRWEWISAAGRYPRPLHCVAIAWEHKAEHATIAKLLIDRGAIVEDSVLRDYYIEVMPSEAAGAVGAVLEAAHSAKQ